MNWLKKSNHREILARCNFRLAAREIAKFLESSNKEAKAQGGYYAYKKEFIESWNKFGSNPSYETALQFFKDAPDYESFIIHFFEGCSPGGIFYRKGIRTAADFVLGDYRLDIQLQDIPDLKELTKEEYAIFGRDSLQEVVYHARPTEFLGHTWKMMVGTIEGKIYQLGASIAFDAKDGTINLTKNVYEHCELFLGTPTEETQGYFIWDTETGKVIFQYAVIKETNTFAANLFVGDRGDKRYGNS